MSDFSDRLILWQPHHGRHGLPWQGGRDPYRIWLSEIMLQQTQVSTVIPYYTRFLARFPDVAALAAAPVEDVMALWSGLGYYARAHNLHRAAVRVIEAHGGRFPVTAAELAELPGVGRSTAAAIAAFSANERNAILDGNVKRVLCRVFGIEGFPGSTAVGARLWALAEALLPRHNEEMGVYVQAQMDLGATICTRSRPACERCPLSAICTALATGQVNDLPTPRPKKTVPRRTTDLAVVTCCDSGENCVLLERRPPAGIWGGLLALPEITAGVGTSAWAASRFGISPPVIDELPHLKHSFTHFTLEITPWHIALPARPLALAEPGWVWVAALDLASAALPTPIRKILEALIHEGRV